MTNPLPTISPEEYLIRDRANAYKSEYCQGHMYAMAGASDPHNVINENISGALFGKLRSKGCRAASSDQRIYAPLDPFFAYPDTVVTCGSKRFAGESKDTLLNPVIIFEILSPSTRDYDLCLKFGMYRTILTLKEYVCIEQNEVHVYHWVQEEWGAWSRDKREYTALSDSIRLESVGIEVSVEELYLDVNVEPE
jgi:Uma2 family endonuclease